MPFQSLAEFLGTKEPTVEVPEPARKLQSAKVISRALLNSEEYRRSLVDRIVLGELAPALECKLWDYAYGKPVDRVEVKDTTARLEQLSPEQLEERALKLAQLARQIRAGTEGPIVSEDDSASSIH